MAKRKYKKTGGGLLGLIDRYKNPLICIGTAAFLLAAYSFACADDMQTRKLQTEPAETVTQEHTSLTQNEETENTRETHEKTRECVSDESWERVRGELGESWESFGEFTITAYCGGPCCCGIWADEDCTTASGAKAVEGVTIAADTSILPFGTTVRIGGQEYTVQDTGGAIKGNRIDIYFEDHEDALSFGVQKMNLEKKIEN